MSFLIQRTVGRGLALNEVRGNVLRIGRGTQAELRSDNPAVALEHAVIESGAGGYSITDRGSITGTYVNGKPVETHLLAKGDILEVGDLRIEVQAADAARPLFLRVASTASRAAKGEGSLDDEEVAAAGPAGGAVKAPKIDFVSAYRLKRPYVTKLSLIAILLIIALAVVAEVVKPEKRKAFMPGGVSSAHGRARDLQGRSIAENCHACHDPWRGVTSAKCSVCHGKATHADNVAGEQKCANCHLEHRGDTKLAIIADDTCIACHKAIESKMKSPDRRTLASVAPITSFGGEHPEFSWPADSDTLRFNHRLHLRAGGIFNGEGRREELACTSCHKLVETRGKFDPAPIRFTAACQRCHRLTFDPRFGDAELPHGADPGLVYGFILQTYAGNRDIAGKSPEEVRRILGTRAIATPDERAVINAEAVIKTKCSLCHEIQRINQRLTATKPVLLAQWLDHARFSHGPHRNQSCESCHAAARTSALTAEVLMPARKECTNCHGAAERSLLGASQKSKNCTLCHAYHERKNLMTRVAPAALASSGDALRAGFEGGGGMLSTILLLAIFVLLLVVLVPVGLALYQRMKPAPPEKTRAPKAAPPPPISNAPTTKIPPLAADSLRAPAAPRPAAPPPPPPSQPAADATQMLKKEDFASGPVAGGTEMMQWYGMLHCTGGPLEGQRFIIEDEGFYIGRDETLSKVVIADSRISKRHVRIAPRSGKVWAIDQNSTNGTFLGKEGGQRITEVELKRGDTLILADGVATFVYQI